MIEKVARYASMKNIFKSVSKNELKKEQGQKKEQQLEIETAATTASDLSREYFLQKHEEQQGAAKTLQTRQSSDKS